MSIVRLFRRPREQPVTPAEPVAVPAPPCPPAPAGQALGAVFRQIEDDVRLTMQVIGHAAEDVQERLRDSAALMAGIRDASVELSELSGAAFEVTTGLADTTRQLEQTGESIEDHVAGTDEFVQDAQELAADVTRRMAELAQAVETIAGVVAVIGTIARQTNLLALNASIEAARAGAAGRGFAVVATEVKALSSQVQTATGDITGQIGRLQAMARESSASVDNIARLLGRVEPVLGSVRDAVRTQIAGAREVAQRADESLQFVSVVSEKAAGMTRMTAQSTDATSAASESAAHMAPALQRLSRRATAFLRRTTAADRRRHPRMPVRLSGQLVLTGHPAASGPVATLDISTGGALVQGAAEAAPMDAAGVLELDGVGRIAVSVRNASEDGLHLAFDALDAATTERLQRLMDRAEQDYAAAVGVVQDAARDAAALFEEGLAKGRVRLDDLLTIEYRRISGTDPAQFQTAALPFYEAVLPAVLARHRDRCPEAILLIACDRNAYVPVHHPEWSMPQRHGDYDWNDLHARNRRIFERSRLLVAARNAEPYALLAFMRHMPNGTYAATTLVTAPIFVAGQLWGNMILAKPL